MPRGSAGGPGLDLSQYYSQAIVFMNKAMTIPEPPAAQVGYEHIEKDIVRFPVWKSVGETIGFNAIGRVSVTTSGGSKYCTGVPIGQRLVLTNAHCVTNDRGQMDVRHIVFRREGTIPRDSVDGDATFEVPYEAQVDAIHTHQGRDGGWSRDFRDDWAILVLDEKSRQDVWFGWQSDIAQELGNTGNFYLAGYSGDLNRGKYMTVEWGCSILRQAGAPRSHLHYNVEHNCDSTKGASGAPIVKIRREGARFNAYIYALNHSGPTDNRFIGYAVTPTAWHETARKLRAMTK